MAVTGAISGAENADYAKEAANLVRGQILEQAAIATTLIARQSAMSVLKLLSNVLAPAAVQ